MAMNTSTHARAHTSERRFYFLLFRGFQGGKYKGSEAVRAYSSKLLWEQEKKIKLSSATSPWLQGLKEKIARCRNDDLDK